MESIVIGILNLLEVIWFMEVFIKSYYVFFGECFGNIYGFFVDENILFWFRSFYGVVKVMVFW